MSSKTEFMSPKTSLFTIWLPRPSGGTSILAFSPAGVCVYTGAERKFAKIVDDLKRKMQRSRHSHSLVDEEFELSTLIEPTPLKLAFCVGFYLSSFS